MALFLLVVTGLLVMQNTLGITLASLLGLDPRMGLLAGSITLSGGHGTGAAWSATFAEKYGLHSAAELAIACATKAGATKAGATEAGAKGAGA